jgi:putative endonuclease
VQKAFQVYLLENDTQKRYVGLSEDPKTRLDQHNAGHSKWTAKYRPWRMIWTSRSMNLSDARRLENKLKRQKGGDGIQSLLEDFES